LPSVSFIDSPDKLPINTIFCIGRNYVKHIEELGNTRNETPIVFLKPVSSVVFESESIALPSFSKNVQFETEVILAIGKGGKHIPEADALSYIAGYGIGLDLTARDTQDALKAKGLPWTISKGFDTSACISPFVSARSVEDPQKLRFTLDVNGERTQTGDTSMMLFPVAHLVAYLSSIFTLSAGDIIFTGTPKGVGQLYPGDVLSLTFQEFVSVKFCVAK